MDNQIKILENFSIWLKPESSLIYFVIHFLILYGRQECFETTGEAVVAPLRSRNGNSLNFVSPWHCTIKHWDIKLPRFSLTILFKFRAFAAHINSKFIRKARTLHAICCIFRSKNSPQQKKCEYKRRQVVEISLTSMAKNKLPNILIP